MGLIVIIFVGAAAVACTPSNSIVQAEGAELRRNCAEGSSMAMNVITSTPSSFAVDIEAKVWERLQLHLEEDSLKVVRLRIQDLLRPQAALALEGVRIFIEKPEADVNTALDDPHYAGSFVLGLQDSQSMLLNIASTLSQLWHTGELSPERLAKDKSLTVTFVPVYWNSVTAVPEDLALPFSCLMFEVPNQP